MSEERRRLKYLRKIMRRMAEREIEIRVTATEIQAARGYPEWMADINRRLGIAGP